ncbi:MAG: hypothetical protein KGI71_06655 [Patescibacteria group bacterium]|nr:hypothetical protein [Patescibacteria group bacterium]
MDIETAREILAAQAWKHPDSYGGFSPEGDYLIVSQHRDSDALTRSNYRSVMRILEGESYDSGHSGELAADRPPVYDWRARHWAVGWIEYIMVRADAPETTLIAAAEILAALADYPVVDESDYSELEFSEACDTWEHATIADRVEWCRECGISIFAARRSELPQDDNGALYETLRG